MAANRSYLGEQLIKNGTITQEQLEEALAYQANHPRSSGERPKLGTVLVRLGLCTDEDIAVAMSQNTGYSLMSLNNHPVDMVAASLISSELAQRYKALPIGFQEGNLLVAMQNPNDLLAIDDLALVTGRKIIPIVVSDDELRAVMDQMNTGGGVTEQVAEEESGEEEYKSLLDSDTDATEKPAVVLTGQIINNAIRYGASDIHVEPQENHMRVRYRVDGVLHEVMQQPRSLFPSVSSRIKVMSDMDIAERRIPQDGRATVKVDGRVFDIRVASLPSVYGEKITMRLLNRSGGQITIDQLGFPPKDKERFLSTIGLPYGFLLVTGPTGSGKSTTLYASLGHLNSIDKNIITLEDPVERRMDGLNQVQMNSKAGMSFASGLRSILRSDPDIIMIGEIRDYETAKIATESALTGHFVLSTLHTNDAASAVTRLGEMGVENFLTASALVGVVGQRLVRMLCPRCREEYTMPREELLARFPDFPVKRDETEVTLYRAKGCLSCNNTGYKGRRGVYEFLSVTDKIRHLILEKASDRIIHETAVSEGMTTMRRDGFFKARAGLTSLEEVLRVIV